MANNNGNGSNYHLEDIQKFVNLVMTPGDTYELRVLDVKQYGLQNGGKEKVWRGFYRSPEALSHDAGWASGKAAGVYFTINPILPAMYNLSADELDTKSGLRAAKDEDVVKRTTLVIDCDPERNPKGISSTDEEHAASLARAELIKVWLEQENGWPEGISADSGNGGHLVYKIDLPASDGELVGRVLDALAAKFSDATIKVDTTLKNASRISKVYGTKACKGSDTPERPHRLSRIISAPEKLEVVPTEKLLAVAELAPKVAPKVAPKKEFNNRNIKFDVGEWLAEHNVPVKRGPEVYKDGRRWILEACPFNPDHGVGTDVAVFQYKTGRPGFKCQHESCKDKVWTDFRSNYEPGYAERHKDKVTTEDFFRFFQSQGWQVRMNEITLDVELNEEPMEGPDMAMVRNRLRDAEMRSLAHGQDALTELAKMNSYHPMKSYFDSLVWDGQDHLAKFFTYVKDKDNVFPKWFTKWGLGAIGRIYEYGAQNRMLVLGGLQGIGKSTLCRWLASGIGTKFYFEGPIKPDDKDDHIKLLRLFIWEAAELGSTTRRADREALKAFLSYTTRQVRPAYEPKEILRPCMCSFIGTLNLENGFLNDPTGSRRFMVSELLDIDWKYEKELDVNQLWAQLKALYDSGERGRLEGADEEMSRSINQRFYIVNSIEDALDGILEEESGCFTPTLYIRDELQSLNLKQEFSYDGKIATWMHQHDVVRRKEYVTMSDGKRKQVWGWLGVRLHRGVYNTSLKDGKVDLTRNSLEG